MIFIVNNNIVIVVLTMCQLTFSRLSLKINQKHVLRVQKHSLHEYSYNIPIIQVNESKNIHVWVFGFYINKVRCSSEVISPPGFCDLK